MEGSVCRTATALVSWASLCVNAKANDLSSDAPNFTAKVVTTAQHGQVSINPDGTFGYTPDANFYGTDSFSYQYFYQYSNTAGEAPNTATVNLTVTLVNDAPVAADVAVTTLEDTLATINLVALDADNTSASLQFIIQTQPTHGTLLQNTNGSYSYTPAANHYGGDSFTYLHLNPKQQTWRKGGTRRSGACSPCG